VKLDDDRDRTADEIAVALREVTVRYDDRVVLERVSLDVRRGEFLGIIGKSGCGKTTLLRTIAGLLLPASGTVSIAGRPVLAPGQDSAMVFQADSLYPWKRVVDNAAFGLQSLGVPRKEACARAEHWLQRVGLDEVGRLKPRQLSGGMRQRVNLVRALAVQPTVLLMDEPFASLDYQTREELQGEMLRLCTETTTTVIFVTHDVTEAVYLADRIAVLDAGRRNVTSVIDVEWGDDRPVALKHTAAFAEKCRVVWQELASVAR
jgi:NitT/TauT family transport system ATP-binding protein